MTHWLAVAVHTPAHSSIAAPLTYRSAEPLSPGTLVRVPLGAREVLGVVWAAGLPPPQGALAGQVRDVAGVLGGLPPLDAHWRALIDFAARYYQRALGEVALAALPPQLRGLSAEQMARRLKRGGDGAPGTIPDTPENIALTEEQARALAEIDQNPGPFLLFGATGSGKTEVYMRAAQAALARAPGAQVLVLVPEINLTPQLEARFAQRFGADAVASLHSGLTPAQRMRSWLAAHTGRARIVLGTRVAVLAPLPGLALIVVDEEHDPSYKQQEGARYSARDLAVYRGRLAGARVILGSATPSLESWHASTPAADGGPGRYQRLAMPLRIGASGSDGGLPRVRRVDMARQPRGALIATPLLAAIGERVARGEQALLLLNRRGYAPVLHCADCGWKSECPHCSAFRVFHKIDRTLRCHHCGLAQRVPRACPGCGNLDIGALGRGTEQLEERLGELLAGVHRLGGQPARIARIDADSTRGKGQLESQLAQVHAGEVDVLVGTQMIAKGHDFRRVTLVAAVNPDAALFSSDFRAPERLFALLLQAAGRAGRDAAASAGSEMWVQTHHPQHPLYAALKTHDYPGFAARQLAERAQAGLPPFTHLALLRADARSQEAAQAFLTALARQAQDVLARDPALATALPHVTWYPAVPLAVQRVAGIERAQMLLESPVRAALQRVLAACAPLLQALRAAPEHRSIVRWAVDVDPLAL
ncbi:primosomal protein N' [Ottowia sp.]|jgi:primosomal protein N' (replication factor Y)|uniref:replication restart helicase PriA n=1 Tax=Ottowia sp. TaxID=1898956 RepID=UPI0025F8B6EE|nr:primosomal protein N' [Ottowia sp.]MBK6615349.1 primosomal protein N' [Ottowia sp.]MBK6746421.1 primosomal protein N' [Ottowia sp.]